MTSGRRVIILVAALMAMPSVALARVHHPTCTKTFTVAMATRADRAMERGTRNLTNGNRKLLARLLRCQRNPQARWFVRWYYGNQARLNGLRKYDAAHPWYWSSVSWFDDSTGTACGYTVSYGVASRDYPCGTRVQFSYGGTTITATVEDWGPASWTGRIWDLNQGSAAALGMQSAGVVDLRYRIL